MKEFLKPWMGRCNPHLILRWWRSKGSPGKLTLIYYGVSVVYTQTVFGELSVIERSFKF